MECLGTEEQELILNWFLEEFSEHLAATTGSTFGHVARLAPHVLKRRRFAPRFLESGSTDYTLFSKLLDQALGGFLYQVHRADLEATKEFLESTATSRTLEKWSD